MAISSSDEETEDDVMFPLEGKYKDEADRSELLAKSQLEREAILAERATQIERAQQNRVLKNMLKERKEQKAANFDAIAESTRRSTRTAVVPKSKDAVKVGQLAEIKKSREEKGTGKKAADLSESKAGESRKLAEVLDMEEREITVDDLNKARIGRSGFHKLIDYPGFEETIIGMFSNLTEDGGR